MFGEWPAAFQGPVLAVTEECRVSVATRESVTDQGEFDPTVISPVYKLLGAARAARESQNAGS